MSNDIEHSISGGNLYHRVGILHMQLTPDASEQDRMSWSIWREDGDQVTVLDSGEGQAIYESPIARERFHWHLRARVIELEHQVAGLRKMMPTNHVEYGQLSGPTALTIEAVSPVCEALVRVVTRIPGAADLTVWPDGTGVICNSLTADLRRFDSPAALARMVVDLGQPDDAMTGSAPSEGREE